MKKYKKMTVKGMQEAFERFEKVFEKILREEKRLGKLKKDIGKSR